VLLQAHTIGITPIHSSSFDFVDSGLLLIRRILRTIELEKNGGSIWETTLKGMEMDACHVCLKLDMHDPNNESDGHLVCLPVVVVDWPDQDSYLQDLVMEPSGGVIGGDPLSTVGARTP